MEKFKINSQDLIKGAGGNEDIFNAINSPANHIFSLQRFAAGTYSIGQNGSTVIKGDSTISGYLYDFTLGRSTDTTNARAGFDSTWKQSGTSIQFAPLSWSDTTQNATSYTLNAYQVSSTETRIAITGGEFTAFSNTGLGLTGAPAVWVGVALDTGTSVFSTVASKADSTTFFAGNVITSDSKNAFASYFKGDNDSYTALYFNLTNKLGTAVDGAFLSGTGTHPMTYSVDFYDAKPNDGSYTVKLNATQNILFASETTLNFNDVTKDEAETYSFNGINFTVRGGAGANLGTTVFSMKAGTRADDAQIFSNFNVTSAASVLFDLTGAGSNTGVNLDGQLYTSSNDSGTVMFSMSGTRNYITFNTGDFTLSKVASDTTYLLEAADTNASGTFAVSSGNTFTLDIDGLDDGGLGTFTFIAGDNSSVTSVADSSNIKIAGAFTSITGDTMTGIQFAFSDSAKANFVGIASFSDTQDSKASFVTFSDTIQISGIMSGTAANTAVFTLLDSGTTFALDNKLFYATNAGNAEDNQLSFISTTLTADSTHASGTFAVTNLAVTGYDMGSNISMAGTLSIPQTTATLQNGFYFYNGGSAEATVTFNGSTGTTIKDATKDLLISAVGKDDAQSATLVGVSSHTFTVDAGTFFLKDGGSTTKIGALTFNEVSDSHVSKLVYDKSASSVGVFGNVALVGSNTSFGFTLNGFSIDGTTTETSAIQIGGITFEGSDVAVVDKANLYKLSNSGTGIFSITGNLGEVSSFTMVQGSSAGEGAFQFGASNTAITFTASGSAFTGVTAIFGAGALHASNTVTVGGGLLNVVDNADSASYKVLIGSTGNVAGISGIDSGATLYSLASATSVITNADGLFTFSGTAVGSVTGTSTQIFQISGDADGVTFALDANGFVTGITGISDGATINITDLTLSDSDHYWTKHTSKLTGSGANYTWSNTALGTWATDNYMGYIVAGSGSGLAFTAYGIESDSNRAQTALNETKMKSKVGTSEGTTFGLVSTVFDSATQVSFINLGGKAYGASDTTKGVLFTDFASNTNRMGLLYQSGTGVIQIAHVPENSGSATEITSINAISDTVSLKLGNVALVAGSEYGVSGTGVTFSVNSSIATVAATTGSDAYIGLGGVGVVFGSGTGVYNIYSGTGIGSTDNPATLKHTLTINGGGATGSASGTFTGNIFDIDVTLGGSVTDTYVRGKADSSLTINDIAMHMYGDSATFAFTAGTTGTSDTLSVSLGTVGFATGSFLAKTTLGLANDSSSLIVDAFSYTGISAATFAIDTESSGTQMVTALSLGGSIKESVASNTAFVFNNSLFTAMGAINFRIDPFTGGTSETLLENSTSATGVWNQAGDYTLNFATGGDVTSTTFRMQSGSSVIMTYAEGSENGYNAKFDYTTGASGTFTTSTTGYFSVSDFYLSSGASESNIAFQYTALSDTTTLSLVIGEEGSHTLKLTAGGGYRDVASTTNGAATTFTFDPDGTGPLPTYTYTAASTLRYNIDSETALSYGAQGLLYSGTATRILDATGAADIANSASTIFKSFHSDTYLPGAGALMTLNIVNGVPTEKFTSGTGVFTATPNTTSDTFHFQLGTTGSIYSYTAITSPVTMEALFTGAANDTGTLLGATGTGVRTTSQDGQGTFWSFGENIGNSYTMLAGSTLQLNIGGVTDGVGFGTETATAGSGTYTPAVGGLFSIADGYLTGTTLTPADSYTYTVTAAGGGLTAVIDNGTTTILLGSVVGTRTSSETQPFSLASDTISGLAGGSLANIDFTSSGTLTFKLTSETATAPTGAAGALWSGLGTRTYDSAEGTATSMAKTYSFGDSAFNIFNPASGLATMQVTVVDGSATETFVSGSGTFTAGAGDSFYFKIGEGTAYSYTAKTDVTMGAYFDATTNSDGKLYSANGTGERFTGAEETYTLIGNSFTMAVGSTKLLSDIGVNADGSTYGSETFTAGTGTLTVAANGAFYLNADYYSNTALLDPAATYSVGYFASGESVALTLNVADGSGTIKITSGFGTRTTETSTFGYQPEGAAQEFTYSTTSVGGLMYSIDSNTTSVEGNLYSGAGVRTFNNQSSSWLLPTVFNSDTYTLANDAIVGIDFTNGVGTETFTLGSATFTAQAGGTFATFHAMMSSTSSFDATAEVYSATKTGAIFTIAIADSSTKAISLVGATGTGITSLTGTENYTIGVLSDTYVMQEGTLKELSFSGVNTADTNTYVNVTNSDYESGTGTLSLSAESSFSVANAFLFGNGVSDVSTVNAADVFTYTASGTSQGLTLQINDSGTKILLNDVVGVRSLNSGTAFGFATVAGYTGTDDIAYTATGLGVTYQISKALLTEGYSATGMLSAGEGTRLYTTGDFTSTTMARTFNQDEGYMPTTGAVMGVNIVEGAGTETFISGSGTFTAAVGEGTFHFTLGDTTNSYTATSVGDVVLGAYFADAASNSGKLYSASGVGQRLTADTETYVLIGDSFTMLDGSTKQLALADVSIDANGNATGSETWSAGTGTFTAAAGSAFYLNADYYSKTSLLTSDATGDITFYASGESVALTLNVDGGSGTIKITSGVGTRELDNVSSFTVMDNVSKEFTYHLSGDDTSNIIYKIDSGTSVYQGELYSGAGTRQYNGESSTFMTPVTFNSDTYTPANDATMFIEAVQGKGSETFVLGSATFTAKAAEGYAGIFHATLMSDTTQIGAVGQVYSATTAGAVFTIYRNDSGTSLVGASGTGITEITTPEDYTIAVLSDTYKMTGLKEFAFNDVTSQGTNTYVSVTGSEFTSGTGTYSVAVGSSFSVADAFLFDGANVKDFSGDILTYTASGTSSADLTLTIDGTNTKIVLGEVVGVRTQDSGTFEFKPVDYTGTDNLSYTAIGDGVIYQITDDIAKTYSATGKLTAGQGTRLYGSEFTSTTMARSYNSDTGYMPINGALMQVSITNGSGSETFVSGSGTLTAETFHFTLGDNTHSYTGTATFGAYFANETDTGKLYSADGSGTRLSEAGDKAFYTFDGAGDSFTMNAGATILLDHMGYEGGETVGSETYTSGTGTYTVAKDGFFSLADEYLSGTTSVPTSSYTYVAETAGTLTVEIGNGSTTLTLDSNLAGLRTETNLAAGTTFNLNDKVYSATTGSNAAYFISQSSLSGGAGGVFYNGTGERTFAGGSETTMYLSDTYAISAGTFAIEVNEGTGSETFASGSATYTADANKAFHFVLEGSTNTYTALADNGAILSVSVDGTNTTLYAASGTGVRDVTDPTAYAVESLGGNVYSFTGTAQITIPTMDSASETAYGGGGTMTAVAGTNVIAAFDSGTNIVETAYTYSMFADNTTFAITMESGTVKTQSITAGSATRDKATDASFVYEYNDNTYTYSTTSKGGTSSAGSLTFVLDSTKPATGAQGTLLDGVGYRLGAMDGYTNSELQITTSYNLASDTEWRLTLSGTAKEDLFNATSQHEFADAASFTFKGTTYTASGTATMQLTANDGDIVEGMFAGSATFVGNSSDTTFEYDENVYRVAESATLILTAADPTKPQFISGLGHKEMSANSETAKTFKYTDGNTYTVTSDYALLTAEGNSTGADVNFAEGAAEANYTSGQNFTYALDHSTNTNVYTALESAALGITGTTVEGATPAYAEFIGGSATRLQDSGFTGQDFEYDGATYTSVANSATWMLTLQDNKAAETVFSAEASRTLTGDTFVYTSPNSGHSETYTVESAVTLELSLVNGQGTETFKGGSGTRAMTEGDTFKLTPSNVYNLASDMTFTATAQGTYRLTLTNDGVSGNSGLSFMGYNVSVVTETLVDGAGTGTLAADSNFGFEMKVAEGTNTYKAITDITFGVTVDGDANTATWLTGSGTMELASGREFYYTPTDGTSNTYKVLEAATFLRTGEDKEYLNAGTGYRNLTAADPNFTATYLENAYTADAGAMIVLSSTGVTTATEGFSSGTATFDSANNGNEFNFRLADGASHTYTGSATLQLNVTNYLAQGIVGATGTGVRDLAAGETYSTTVIGNVFTASSGTYTIDLNNVTDFDAVTETFTGGTLVDEVTGGNEFYLNDEKLGVASGTETIFTYTAVGDATLTMTVTDGIEDNIVLDGAGVRTDTSKEFSFTLNNVSNTYTATSDLIYRIDGASATQVGAGGFLFTGSGTRLTTTEGGEHTFNSDTYTVGASATMKLTVDNAVGNEVMTQGTATYVATASSNGVFHFGDDAYNAYQSDTTLKISLEESGSESLFYISGQGTRTAAEKDESMTIGYQSDTYTAQAGSSTILFTATGANGELTATSTSILGTAGVVVDNVSATGVFHFNPNAGTDWYEYTAGNAVNISLSLSDSVQSFSVDPNAKRTASETSFAYSDNTYTTTSVSNINTYSLTGSGTNLVNANLTDAIFAAKGFRTNVSGDTATSNWNNTYALTEGTYSLTVENGTGTDVFSAGTGSQSYALGTGVFNYGDSGTKFTANIDGATLSWNVDSTGQTETLTQGAAGNGSGTYIMAGTANVTLGSDYSTNVTLSAVDSTTSVDGVVTLKAVTFDKDAFTGGVSEISGSAGGLNVALGANSSIGINGKLFEATDTAAMTADSSLSVFSTTGNVTISAEGNFQDDKVTIGTKAVGISDDTDVAAFFTTNGIQRLEKLTNGITVSNAAGAVRAVTDSTGTFIFNSSVISGGVAPADSTTQTFSVSGTDDSVIFQLDSATGLVTGITGLDVSDSANPLVITITDTTDAETLTVSSTGKVLTRNTTDGSWSAEDVKAVAYLVTLGSGADDTLSIYAIDSMSDLTRVDASVVGSLTDLNLNITVDGAVSEKPVYVVNKSADRVINVSGNAFLEGIGLTEGSAAIKLTSATDQFNLGTISGANFTENVNYGVSNGKFSVDASGAMDVVTYSSGYNAYITIPSADSTDVEVIATVDAANRYTINETPVTVETYDSDGTGKYRAMFDGSTVLSGLDPNDVDTGAVLVNTTTDATTFAITDTKVTVTGDTDGMTLAIKSDTLAGLDGISTDATINVSNDALKAGDTLTIGTDTVTLKAAEGADSIAPIKWNDTNKEWTSGLANSVAGATGYLVTVNADNAIELYYTNATQTIPAQTTNVNDYVAVFGDSGIAPTVDGGALPVYGNNVTINGGLADSINVSLVAGTNTISAVVDGDDTAKDLILTTSNGNYNINGQQIIPTAQITVNAYDNNSASVPIGSAVTISHDGMQFNATSDTVAAFVDTDIYLHNTTKVTNTNGDSSFYVDGTVTFDNIAVKASTDSNKHVTDVLAVSSLASASGSGLSVDGNGLTLSGGDLNYTVDVTGSTPTISGIDGGSTLDGALSGDAKIMTASTGVFKINASDPFTISNDSDVTFTTANNSVTAIDSLEGVVTGNFSADGGVSIDGAHSVYVINDDQIGVTANGTRVTEIDGVGSASTDVVIANAGGATLVTTNLNGSFIFGTAETDSTIHSHYTVEDNDSQVSFLTSTLDAYAPSVTGVRGLNDGTIAISQDETGFSVNDSKITLSGVGSDVTVEVANDTLNAVFGLEGSVNGLDGGVFVLAVDSDVTINGAALQIIEPEGTTVAAYASSSGFDTVSAVSKDATVAMARNAYVQTHEQGAYTFGESDVPKDTYTISGDDSVIFETDGKSQVKNIADFAGTLKSTAYNNTVNGAVVAVDTDAAITDVSIVSAGTGVSSVLGLSDGDSVTVPTGTSVQMPATSSTDTDTAITINGKSYNLEGDTDGVAIKAGDGIDSVSGLAAGARLTVDAAGVYNVNNEILSANRGDVIIGDEEGSAHVYDSSDVNFDTDTTTDEIINQITNTDVDRYVESLESSIADAIVDSTDPAVLSSLNGNIQMTLSGGTDTTESGATRPQTADFSRNTGIKKVDLQGDGDQNIKFNDEGGNIAIIESGAGGAKSVSLGNGGDLAVVEDTGLTPVNITTGRGKDTVVTKGRNVKMNLTAGGSVRVMPTAGTVEMEGYDASTGAGIQLTNSNVALAVKTNAIKLQNGSTTVNGGAAVVTNPNAETVGESIVNFYNLKGLMTKVGYTHDDGGMVDLRSESGDVVMKGNYTEGSAQRKGGGSTLTSGSGNDTAFGGAGDAFDLGSGYNTITMDTDRSLSEAGAIVSQSAEQGRTEVNNFHAGYSDTGDRIRIDVSKATVKFVGGALRFVLGAATLILNAVASNADLAESADETDSKIGSVNSQKVLIDDSGSTNSYRVEVASEGNVINVERVDDVITQSYMGDNSGVNLATFDESAFVNLNQGEGMLGGEYVRFGGITKLQGGSTVSTLIGNGGANNTLVAGVGGGSIWGGGASNDTMSGVGSTLAENKATSNSFFFMNGDGKDLITDFDFLTADNADRADRINIGNAAVTEVITSGNDVIISLTNEADKLTIKEAVGKDFNFDYGQNSLTAQVNTNSLDFDGRASYYQATGKNAAITANSELSNADIWLNNDANFSSNLFLGDIKYLNAANVEGKATLVGNSNDNVITASSDGTSMWGGDKGGNDVMIGGAGADIFWYGKNNNGNDTITQIDGNDTINLYDISLDDISTADVSSNEIAITLKETGNVLRVQGNVTAGEGFRLKDGTTYTVDSNRNWVQK